MQDAVDELRILMKLFKQQSTVIGKMIQDYKTVDQQNGNTNAHVRARNWLKHADLKVNGYITKCEELLETCDRTDKMVSSVQNARDVC